MELRLTWPCKAGVTPTQPHAFSTREWLGHAKEALFDPDPRRSFAFEVEASPGSRTDSSGTAARIEWTAAYEGGRSYTCACSLSPCVDSAASLGRVLTHLCSSYRVLKV